MIIIMIIIMTMFIQEAVITEGFFREVLEKKPGIFFREVLEKEPSISRLSMISQLSIRLIY